MEKKSFFARAGLALLAGGILAAGSVSAASAAGEYRTWPNGGGYVAVSGYGSQVNGNGQWRPYDTGSGPRSYLDANVWYTNADDHKKYAHFWTQFNTYGAWNSYDDAETGHSSTTSASWLYANTGLNLTASNQFRAEARVCLDVPYRTDPCSGWAYSASSYWS
ncbi:hypothetical protein [Catellatospora chokoriensis]|uniref:Bacteriocin (Lactococcin_972) n=1 Tax=Catellatospora chokoriensis TaxID=310353 RepID=A0A8J3KCV4_9ACTN|nr:hypothetical protein [Catellatospora chokoriensis]GIF92739.1 hypothetical protein Cch02nite_61830 [Catellatospora chokoriensis]